MGIMNSEQIDRLTELIDAFGEEKDQLKQLKDSSDKKNAEIKQLMQSCEVNSFGTHGFNATYFVKETTTVNEDKLLAMLQQRDGDRFRELGVIKTKEYVDPDALEAAIFNSAVDEDTLIAIKNCSTTVRTPTLVVKRKGGKSWQNTNQN